MKVPERSGQEKASKWEARGRLREIILLDLVVPAIVVIVNNVYKLHTEIKLL